MRNSNNNRSRRPRGGRSFDHRDSGRSNRMHDAVCADCGDDCKVPFMPSSGKPVYCSNCFEDRGNGGGNSRRANFSNDRNSRRPNFPRRSNRPTHRERPQKNYDRQFDVINEKLDQIIELLAIKKEVKEVVEAKPPVTAEEQAI